MKTQQLLTILGVCFTGTAAADTFTVITDPVASGGYSEGGVTANPLATGSDAGTSLLTPHASQPFAPVSSFPRGSTE